MPFSWCRLVAQAPTSALHHQRRCRPLQPSHSANTQKMRPRTASAITSFSLSKSKIPRSADSGVKRRTPNLVSNSTTDADRKLGMTRARSRIHSFGATATAGAALDGSGGGGDHQQAILRATTLDSERRDRAHHSCSTSTGDGTDTMPRRGSNKGQERDKSEREGPTKCLVGDARNRDPNGQSATAKVQTADAEENDKHTDTSTHLGAIDISKVSNIGKHAPLPAKAEPAQRAAVNCIYGVLESSPCTDDPL